MQTLRDDFWQYACSIYKSPGLKDVLLVLQGEHDFDVSMILLMMWLGQKGIALDKDAVQNLQFSTQILQQDMLQPMRTLRRAIKQNPDTEHLYENFKSLELQLEKSIFDKLAEQTGEFSAQQGNNFAAKNLYSYLQKSELVNSLKPWT